MEHFYSFAKRLFQFQGVVIDNYTFRLHYKLTFTILVALSILVAWRQHFGNAINCLKNDYFPSNFINDYCYTYSTFSIKESWKLKVGGEVPYPGVDKYKPDQTEVYHTYYQWVSIVLFLQAVLFYVPRCFWRTVESGRIKELMKDFKDSVEEKDLQYTKLELLADRTLDNFNRSGKYLLSFAVAECFNAINVVGQIFLMDLFLGGEFLSYGSNVIHFQDWKSTPHFDPMVHVFPKMTQCTIRRYGASGDVQRHSIMCILPINALNEKIYLFLWFWFIVLSALSCLAVICRVALCLSPQIRMLTFEKESRLVRKEDLATVLSGRRAGDWFLIHLLSQNLNDFDFRDFISVLAKRMKKDTREHPEELHVFKQIESPY